MNLADRLPCPSARLARLRCRAARGRSPRWPVAARTTRSTPRGRRSRSRCSRSRRATCRSPPCTSRRRRARRRSTSRRACPASSTSASTPKAPSSRRARCCSRWTRSRSRRRSTRSTRRSQRNQAALEVAKANLARTKPLAAAERAVAEGPRRRAGPVRAGGGGGRAGEGAARGGEAQPFVHDDHLAGRRRQQLRRGRRRHVRQRAEQPAHDGLGADADVDQLQHLRERDGAHPQRGEGGAAPAARRTGASSSRSSWSTARSFPHKGRITFADPSYNPQTGTFLIRASVDNPEGRAAAEPVRAHATRSARSGRTRSSCRSARCSRARKGHFVWVVNKDGKAELRPVVVGDWYGDCWFIAQGLAAGDQVVVDGALRLAPGRAGQGDRLRAEARTRPRPRRCRAARRVAGRATSRRASRRSTPRRCGSSRASRRR